MGARLHELAYTSCLELGDTWCFQTVIGVQVGKVKLIIASISTARMKTAGSHCGCYEAAFVFGVYKFRINICIVFKWI